MTVKGYRKPAYYLSDGGRQGHAPEERNDCTVRALVHACGLEYAEAYQVMAAVGRLPNRGGKTCLAVDALAKRGRWSFQKQEPCWPWKTLAAWLREHPSGTWILTTYNHTLAVRNGVVFDSWRIGMRHRVCSAWRVEALPPPKSVDARHGEVIETKAKGEPKP